MGPPRLQRAECFADAYRGVAQAEGGSVVALPSVLTVEEVADLMRIDRKTAYAAIACGEVPGVRRIGRCIRVSRDVLLRWLELGDVELTARDHQ
jgi:excisionase family DNA binding protein